MGAGCCRRRVLSEGLRPRSSCTRVLSEGRASDHEGCCLRAEPPTTQLSHTLRGTSVLVAVTCWRGSRGMGVSGGEWRAERQDAGRLHTAGAQPDPSACSRAGSV
eukprot:2318346-Rhodomonas_salina.2